MTTDQGNGNATDPVDGNATDPADGNATDLVDGNATDPAAGTVTGSEVSGESPLPGQVGESAAQDLSGWYQASDGQWYQHPGYAAGSDRPERQPQPQSEYPEPEYPQSAYAQPAPYSQAQYPQSAYAQPAPYSQAQYPQAQHSEGQYSQGQYSQAHYPPAQYSQGQYPPGQYPPGPYPPAGYGAPGYGSPGYGSPGYGYVAAVGTRNNGMAIASLICAIGGIFFLGIPSVLGIIFGFVARSQIQRSNGTQTGSGLALAGIIVGFCVVAAGILIVSVVAIGDHTCSTSNGFGSC